MMKEKGDIRGDSKGRLTNDGADDGGHGDVGEVKGDLKVFDDILDYLGIGRWFFLYFIVGSTWYSCLAMQTMGGAFVAPVINYTCRLPDNTTTNITTTITTTNTTTITPIDECRYSVLEASGRLQEEPCTEWDFDHTVYGNTLTSEMSLVCDRAYLVPMYTSIYMIGSTLGAGVGGILSDKVGRFKVYAGSVVMYVVVASSQAFLHQLTTIMITRFILGFLHLLSMNAGYVLVLEVSVNRVRPVVGLLLVLPWALGTVVFGGLGYALPDWRNLQLVISVPYFLIIPALVFLDESPRWLLVRGEVKKAQKILNKAAKWQGALPPSSNTLNTISNNLQAQIGSGGLGRGRTAWIRRQALDFMLLFRNRRLRVYLLVVCVCLFTTSLVYFSLSLSAVNLSVDPYIFMTLSGLVEVPSYSFTGPIVARLGRKPPAIFNYLIVGFTMLTLSLLPQAGWSRVMLAILGKMCTSSVLLLMFLYTSELFPTEVRLQGLGIGLMFSRLGSIVSPFINDILVPVNPWLTFLVFGGLSLLSGCLIFLLPETKGVAMPDIVAEVEDTPLQLSLHRPARGYGTPRAHQNTT